MKALNVLKDQKVNLMKEEDIAMVEALKQEVQELEDERDMGIARKQFVQMQLEGERPKRFFCKMNKKCLAKAQFKELHVEEVDKDGRESMRIITEQKSIEWEVLKYYFNLYSQQEGRVNRE